MTSKRKYQLQRRAERQEDTRRRIAAAAAALHEEVGPARTTISAIAARAGVERLTVYRHFPDERALLLACQQHHMSTHPPPDPTPWADIDDPVERLRSALDALYVYYEETEEMTANVLRDASVIRALAELLTEMVRYHEAIRTLLSTGWTANADLDLMARAALGLALEFETWRSLVRRQGLTHDQAVEEMVQIIRCLVERR